MKLKHRLQQRVQRAVDKGLDGVEKLHLKIAAMPLSTLKKFAGGPAKKADEASQRKIGEIYDAIRSLNKKMQPSTVMPLSRRQKAVAAAAAQKAKAAGLDRASARKDSGNSQHAAT